MSTVLKTHNDYTVAWVCALPLEAVAVKAVLDKTHPPLPQPVGDDNAYELGEISGHNIVIVYLPAGVYGTTSAATVVAQMRTSFPSIRFALLVGIGGGVPSARHDIRLGDVVVSQPTDIWGGVVQYDYGKAIGGTFQRTGMMNQPPQILLTAIARLRAVEIEGHNPKITAILLDMLSTNTEIKAQCPQPTEEQDRLFNAAYNHQEEEETCAKCDQKYLLSRDSRLLDGPRVHYGLIASGNQVMKDGHTRDRLAKDIGILCFEMEAAGLMNQIPCLVIRGICDYSDSHKNKHWQGYAALTAAVYGKVLLSIVPVNQYRRDQARTACWMVPFARNPRFLGRQNLVLELERAILHQGGVRKMAIAGLGGTGKTQIALELAYQVRSTDSECSVFWISSTSRESIDQAFLGISEHLGLQGVSLTEAKSRVKNYLSSEKVDRWLLIIDNADDTEMWISSGISPALKSYLPYSECGSILFTTRNQQLATQLVGPEVINLTEMDDLMATKLLQVSLIQKDRDQQTMTQLIHQLSCLPLAIVQAASYINETGTSLESYLNLLQGQESVLVELLSQDFEDEWRYTEIQNPVAATWLISFRQIQRLNIVAADYLSFMSCIHPRNIPLSLLPASKSTIQQQKALGLLKAYSFITREDHDQLIHLHRLVHLATRNWLRVEGRLAEWIQETVQRLSEVFPSCEPENRVRWRKLMPHAQYLLRDSVFQFETQDGKDLIQNVAGCLCEDGKYQEAEGLFRNILEKEKSRIPGNDLCLLRSIMCVGMTSFYQGRLAEAEQLQMEALEMSKILFGPMHPNALINIADLARTFSKQGQWKKAEQLQTRVLETSKILLGPEHPITSVNMANLASTYCYQGRWEEAEQLQMKALETSKTLLGPEHPNTLAYMADLSNTFSKQGQWKKAEQLQTRVLETSKILLGPEHPDTLVSMANLASTYCYQGRWEEAEQIQIQKMKMSKTVLGQDHPSTLMSMEFMSYILRNLGRHSEALSMLESCVQLQHQKLGPTHPDTIHATATLEKWQEDLAAGISSLKIRTSSDQSPPSNPDTTLETYSAQAPQTSQIVRPKRNILSGFHRRFLFKKKD